MDPSVQTFITESPQYRPRMLYFGVTTGEIDEQTVTFPSAAGASQGDFVVIYNQAGESEALWLDIDGDGTPPSAAEYLAAQVKTVVAVTTGDGADDVAATAAGAATIADVTITDNTDGTVTFTQDEYGVTPSFSHYDEDGSGGGSISVAVDNAGVDPAIGNGSPDATVEQTGLGTFVVTFAQNYQRAPEVGVTVKTDNRVARVTDSTIFAVTIELQDLSGGDAADGDFSMVVLGSDAKDAIAQM